MKYLTKIFILLIALVNILNAEKLVFDLDAQNLENTLNKKCVDSRYEISKDIEVDTNLRFDDGYYFACWKSHGYYDISMKTPVKNFTLNMEIVYENTMRDGFGGGKVKDIPYREIKLTDVEGNVLKLRFGIDDFYINDKMFKADIDYTESIVLNITNKHNRILVYIDEQKLYEADNDFFGLKFMNSTIAQYRSNGDRVAAKAWDQLKTLKLYSND